jgi:hypothetical protein
VTGFRFVDEHQAEYHITDLCRVAGVARSSFCGLVTFRDYVNYAPPSRVLTSSGSRISRPNRDRREYWVPGLGGDAAASEHRWPDYRVRLVR